MSVMISKKKFGWGVGGCVETYPIFVGFFEEKKLTLQGPLDRTTWRRRGCVPPCLFRRTHSAPPGVLLG